MAIKGAEGYKTAEGQELEEMNKLSNNLNDILSGKDSEKEPVVIEGVITFGDLTWENGKARVTVNKTTSDNLSIEYQVLDKNNNVIRSYQTIANGGAVSNLNLGDFVIARLTDGQNHGDIASIEVTDGIAPTISIQTGIITRYTIQVTNVVATDNEAGMPNNIIYNYYIKKSVEENYPSIASYSGTDISYTFTEIELNTS